MCNWVYTHYYRELCGAQYVRCIVFYIIIINGDCTYCYVVWNFHFVVCSRKHNAKKKIDSMALFS